MLNTLDTNIPHLLKDTGRLPISCGDQHIAKLLGNRKHYVRTYGIFADQPQHQSTKYIPSIEMSFPNFLQSIKNGTAQKEGLYWAMYSGHGDQDDVFQSDLQRLISFKQVEKLQLNWLNAKDTNSFSLWIAPPGHTEQLHYDGYANLHFQLHGSKKWTLFPPDTSLSPVSCCRCMNTNQFGDLNFSRLTMKQAKKLETPIVITVNAGECIYVPAGWWHQVEGSNGGNENIDWVASVNWFEPTSSARSSCRCCKWRFFRLIVGNFWDGIVERFCPGEIPIVEMPAPRSK